MSENRPTAIVYIDGLNLFNFARSAHPGNQNIDVLALAKLLLPNHDVIRVNYFTAIMKTLDGNPEPSIRQRLYLDRLAAGNSKVFVHLGRIRIDTRIYPKAPKEIDRHGNQVTEKIFKFEEKETDVRIAIEMIVDGISRASDLQILISSDSDFKPLAQALNLRLKSNMKQVSVKSIPKRLLLEAQLT